MPRVRVETLRSTFAGRMVTASTPAEQQIFQNAMAVCDAMTSDMDARANAITAAKAAAAAPTLSMGGDIVSSAPVRGWDAGADAQAIRGKQKDERAYADKQAERQSAFTESSAYTSWVKNAPTLRQNVMNLYTRQVELEALYAKNNPPPSQRPPPSATPAPETASNPPSPAETSTPPAGATPQNVTFGTFASDKSHLTFNRDHTEVHLLQNGTKVHGTWSIGPNGHVQIKSNNGMMQGDFSADGKTFTTLKGIVFTQAAN
jgi:hypothetical protein